jgi:uncharacterized protein (TIGR03437 family)
VNYIVPPGTAHGSATVTVASGDGTVSTGRLEVQPVAPGIFTVCCARPEFLDDDGVVPAGQIVRTRGGVRTVEPLFDVSESGQIVRVPVNFDRDADEVSLVVYGTGLRFRSSLENTVAAVGGSTLPLEYAGPQGDFPGVDQVNINIPAAFRSLFRRSSGLACLRLDVDGRLAGNVCLAIK